MSRLIKICGITSVADARLCAAAGAHRLGVIFAPSPRRVTLDQAAAIAAAVPGTAVVGVFRGADAQAVAAAVRTANLALVQVHDCPDPEAWADLADRCGRPVLPALTAEQALRLDGRADGWTLLLDLAKDPARRTAAHRAELLGAAARRAERGRPVVLAGGLDPDNVAAAVRAAGCLGVDVCGGVETSPGRKDPRLVRRFIAAVAGLEATDVH